MFDRLRLIVGSDAIRHLPGGSVRVSPPTTDAVAGVLGVAHDEGWRVLIEGGGTWRTDLAPADIILSLGGLDDVRGIHVGELGLTAEAGTPLDQLRHEVMKHDAWLPMDPPGRADRSLGSVLATATTGPLRNHFGPIRDRVLGLTVVTGDGRVVRIDGPAAHLHVGAFGAFGAITECRVQLQARPQADITWVTEAHRDTLTAAARELDALGISCAAVELFSPALASRSDWLLAVRIVGAVDDVEAEGQLVTAMATPQWNQVDVASAQLLWSGSARALSTAPVTLRLAAVPAGMDDILDLVSERLGEGMVSASVSCGMLRWSGVADAELLRSLRAELTARETPMTLERAPWRVCREVGHMGAYREGNNGVVSRHRQQFDPGRVLVNALDPEPPS